MVSRFSCLQLFEAPWSVVHRTLLCMGFPRGEYCSGLPCPPPGDLPNPPTEPGSFMSPALAGRFFTTRATWQTQEVHYIQFSSVIQSCLTLCDPMNCSMSGLPVHCQLPDFTQTHVHLVRDAIQPPRLLSSPSAFSLSQHQGIF